MELAHEMVVAQHAKLLKMNVPTSKDAEKIEPEYQMEDLKLGGDSWHESCCSRGQRQAPARI